MFSKFTKLLSKWTGNPKAFIGAMTIVVIWIISGHYFSYNNTWQLVINTTTTIITFLMVFIIQNSQNRETLAIQIKLDELIRALKGARSTVINIEDLSDEDIEAIHKKYENLQNKKSQSNKKPNGA